MTSANTSNIWYVPEASFIRFNTMFKIWLKGAVVDGQGTWS